MDRTGAAIAPPDVFGAPLSDPEGGSVRTAGGGVATAVEVLDALRIGASFDLEGAVVGAAVFTLEGAASFFFGRSFNTTFATTFFSTEGFFLSPLPAGFAVFLAMEGLTEVFTGVFEATFLDAFFSDAFDPVFFTGRAAARIDFLAATFFALAAPFTCFAGFFVAAFFTADLLATDFFATGRAFACFFAGAALRAGVLELFFFAMMTGIRW